jgi:hypothetical protein
VPKVQQGDNSRQLKWHQAHKNFYDRHQTTILQNIAGHLLQQNPETYNRNRFFVSSKNCFKRWRFESATVHACGFELGILGRGPVAFGEALSSGTRLTLFSYDKPDRFFTVIKF